MNNVVSRDNIIEKSVRPDKYGSENMMEKEGRKQGLDVDSLFGQAFAAWEFDVE